MRAPPFPLKKIFLSGKNRAIEYLVSFIHHRDHRVHRDYYLK